MKAKNHWTWKLNHPLCEKPIILSTQYNNSLLPCCIHIFKYSHHNSFANVANIVFCLPSIWSVIWEDTPDICLAICIHIGAVFSHAVHISCSAERMCGLIPGPVCSLCNYQLDFISQENNNSPTVCVGGPWSSCCVWTKHYLNAVAAVYHSVTQSEGEMSSSYDIYHVITFARMILYLGSNRRLMYHAPDFSGNILYTAHSIKSNLLNT